MRLLFVTTLLLALSCNAGTQKASEEISYAPEKTLGVAGEGITGTWEFRSSTPRGNRKSKITIVQDGDTATGTGDQGDFAITINGNQVSWEQEASTPMGKMDIRSVGTIKDENNMAGTLTMSGGPMAGQEMQWTAKRIQ